MRSEPVITRALNYSAKFFTPDVARAFAFYSRKLGKRILPAHPSAFPRASILSLTDSSISPDWFSDAWSWSNSFPTVSYFHSFATVSLALCKPAYHISCMSHYRRIHWHSSVNIFIFLYSCAYIIYLFCIYSKSHFKLYNILFKAFL